jgi:hypothetical protein
MSDLRVNNIGDVAETNVIPTPKLVNRDEVFGFDQTWQDVTGSRTSGVTYTNTTGKPIVVCVWSSLASGGQLSLMIDGIQVGLALEADSATSYGNVIAIVPDGSTYTITKSGGGVLGTWSELR